MDGIVDIAEIETETLVYEPPSCSRCDSLPEHELEGDDGGIYLFCQKCYEDFLAFMESL